MTSTPRRWARGAWRRLASAPLKLSPPGVRAEFLTSLWDDMIVRAPIGGTELMFFAPTPLLRMRADTILTKERDTIAWLETIPADAVLWDIGANVGVFTLYAAARRRCSVLAFEPSAANYAVLTRNLQLNNATGRVTAYCLALAGETALGVLNLDSAAMGTAMSQFGKAGDRSPYSSNRAPVTHGMVGFTVDDFVARFSPPLPTHLKIDVDGLEWPILQGAQATLRHPGLHSLIVELSVTHGAERDRAVAFLGSCGFALRGQGSPQGDTEQAANHLFVRV